MSTMKALQTATLNARIRTGDKTLGVSVKAGTYSIERAIKGANGRYVVHYLQNGLNISDCIAYLDAMNAK